MNEDLKSALKEWGLSEQWVDKLEDEEVFDLQTLLQLPESEVDRIITKAGPRAILKSKMQEAIQAKQSVQSNADQENGKAQQGNGQQRSPPETNDVQDDSLLHNPLQDKGTEVHNNENNEKVTDENNRQGSSRIRIAPSLSGKRPHQNSEEDSELKRLCLSCVNGNIVINYFEENGELNDETRSLLAGVIFNEYLKNDYNKRFPVEEEKSFTDSILKLFPTEKRNIWMAPEESSRDTAAGRGRLLLAYYGKRRVMKRGGLLKKKTSAVDNTSINVEDLADIDGDVDPDEFEEKLLWLTNNKTLSSRLTEYWKFTAKGRLRKFISGKISTAEYMETYPALSEMTGYLLLESDFETLFEGASMQLYAAWPTLAAFIESKVPKNVKAGILDTLTPEGKKIKTIQALPYLFSVVTAAKRGKNKQWRPSREESAESILLHVLETSAILTTLGNRLKEKYEPYNLNLGPQAIVVGETVDSITKSYVRVNSVLYEVDNPMKAVDITFKIMHVLDCQYPKESEREWFFLERCIYRINIDKKNPLTGKTSAVFNDFSRYQP